jgi:hypothetical protein
MRPEEGGPKRRWFSRPPPSDHSAIPPAPVFLGILRDVPSGRAGSPGKCHRQCNRRAAIQRSPRSSRHCVRPLEYFQGDVMKFLVIGTAFAIACCVSTPGIALAKGSGSGYGSGGHDGGQGAGQARRGLLSRGSCTEGALAGTDVRDRSPPLARRATVRGIVDADDVEARRKQRRDQSRCESFHPRTYSSQWQHYGQVVDTILMAVSFI